MNTATDHNLILPLPDGDILPRSWLEAGTAVLDPAQRILELTPTLADWLGAPARQWLGQDLVTVLRSKFPEWETSLKASLDSQQVFAECWLQASSRPTAQWYRLEIARHPSAIFCRLYSALPPRAELAEAAWDEHLYSTASRREMFVRLMQAEAKLENLVQRWPGVIFSQRADFTFQFVSPKIEALTGVPLVQWSRPPQRFWEVVHESDVEEVRQQIKRALNTRPGVTSTYRVRHALSGQVAYVLEHRQAVLSSNGLLLGYEGVWLDVTRQTIAERRLSTAAWKETLGLVTMGLAHDFSNIMAGIHALSESFLTQVDASHPFCEGLNLIKQHSLQASQLVQRIIHLHHGKTGERNYHDLNTIVSDVVDLTRKILPRQIQIQLELAPDALALYVDAVEYCQVILNLVLNAVDAMPRGGQLTVRTWLRAQHPPAPACVQGTLPRLPGICLEVQDTGCGIPANHLAAVFDPFFTTKPMNKGSGLGLYNARLFVEKHQGAIAVVSTLSQGTTFSVWLPQADFSEAERALTPNGQRCRVLLVGQASEILQSTTEQLRLHGCHVVVAHSREQTFALLETAEYPFTGLMVLADPTALHLSALIPEARLHSPSLKLILQIVGCNHDELDHKVLEQADLVMDPSRTEEDLFNQLKSLLEGKPAPDR